MTNQRPGNKSRGISDDVTASVYLVMMLSYLITPPKPVLHSGSCIDRQWYSLRGYRPFKPHPLLYEITCIYNTILNFIWGLAIFSVNIHGNLWQQLIFSVKIFTESNNSLFSVKILIGH